MMRLGGGYAKDEKNVYGRVQAGSCEVGLATRGDGHAHSEGPGHKSERAAALGQPGARRRHGHAGQQALAQRVRLGGRAASTGTAPRHYGARHLKKSARLLCKGPAVKYAFIVRHPDVWPTRAMCPAMNVSASEFYEWFGRPASERSLSGARLTRSIRESFELSDRTFGSLRVWHDLRATGEQCGVNRVARLMKLANLQARRKRRRLPGDGATRQAHHIAPNHLQREFEALEPNQKWVADFTYIWTAEGWLYAAAVMDPYSRRIVGWSMSDTMQARDGERCLADGFVVSRSALCADASLGPGQPVHQR